MVALGTVVAASALAWGIYLELRAIAVPHPGPNGGAAVTDPLDLIKVTITVTGFVGAILVGVYGYRKQRLIEGDAHRADAEQLAQRYTTAADQLGHEKAAVRLAGVYAMAQLADDWDEQRQVCIDVLCAYLRMPYEPDSASEKYREGEREVRLTIIRIIRDHLQDPNSSTTWCGRDLSFTNATFDGGDFGDAKFIGGKVSFEGAKFSGGDVLFGGAEFTGGDIIFADAEFTGGRVSFRCAKFTGGKVYFEGAKFASEIFFEGAEFTGGEISFDLAEFTGGSISLDETKFTGGTVSFDDAIIFTGGTVSFRRAEFTGGMVIFKNAGFEGGAVYFSRAKFIGGDISFDGAVFNGGAVSFEDAEHTSGDISFDGAGFTGGQISWGPFEPPAAWTKRQDS